MTKKGKVIDLADRRAAKKPRYVRCLTLLTPDERPEDRRATPSPAPAPRKEKRLYEARHHTVPTTPPPAARGPYARYTIEPDQMQGERLFAVCGWITQDGKEVRTVVERFWSRKDAQKKYPNAVVLNQPSP